MTWHAGFCWPMKVPLARPLVPLARRLLNLARP
jgi:hypothetical protein